ncbi:MAG: DUF58 domain-containing protein [Clostridiales bacterium]|nr:DUF58 domain-containing protein [Clostridiales bacterium]
MKKNRIILCLIIVATGIYVSFFGGYISYGLFFGSLLIPILSLIYIIYVYIRCRIYQLIDHKTVVKEEHVPYKFILANEDFMSFTSVFVSFRDDYSTVDSINVDKNYYLLPGDRVEQNTSICCHYRGEYLVGAEYVYVEDYLNLFRFRFEAPSPIMVRVLPRIIHLDSLHIGVELEGRSRNNVITSAQKVPDIEIRNYVPGDERKMIHWKSVAKQQKLMTRKYTEDPKTEIVLHIDLTKKDTNDLDRMIIEDKIIETTLAICDYYYRCDIPVVCMCDDGGLKSRNIISKSDFDGLFNFCTYVYFKASLSIGSVLAESSKLIRNRTANIIITHTMSDSLICECYRMLELDNDISVIYIGSDEVSEFTSKLDKRIRFCQITLHQEITEVI